MEIHTYVEAKAAYGLNSFDSIHKSSRRVYPGYRLYDLISQVKAWYTSRKAAIHAIHTRTIHLHRREALFFADLSSFIHVAWLVAANPSIDLDTIPHFSPKKLPDRNSELLALDIPQSNI